MTPIARKHHYNPRMLVSGFTPSGKKSDNIWVFDGVQGKVKQSTTKAVAWELDYYTMDVQGERPDVAEEVFGRIESVAANVIRDIIARQALPSGGDFGALMAFLTLMYVRGPAWRQTAAAVPEQVSDMQLRVALSTRELWEATQAAMEKAGYARNQVPYEEMREYVESEEFGLKLANPGPVHVKLIAAALQHVPPLLARRNWCLLIAEDDTADFVSSDNPATLVWTAPGPAAISPPGLGYRDTEVAMALHRRLALVGRYEPASEKVLADSRAVALINGRTAGYATRYVYGPCNDFVLLGSDGRLATSADWFASRSIVGSER